MTLRIVFLGDIVGRPGWLAVRQQIPVIRERYAPSLILANAENAANGSGLTPELYAKIRDAGVHGMTLGDHVYRKQQIFGVLEREADIIRPANLPAGATGKRWMKLQPEGQGMPPVYVVTLLGRLFMNLPADSPFTTIDAVLAELPEPRPIVIVEMHAEATSEKQAMGWYLNGRAAAVLGTHTHIPTNDARVLPANPEAQTTNRYGVGGGTAYITDLGMSGPYDSVIGRSIRRVLDHMTTGMPHPFDVAEGEPRVCGVVIDIDPSSRRAVAIEPLILKADTNAPPFVAAR